MTYRARILAVMVGRSRPGDNRIGRGRVLTIRHTISCLLDFARGITWGAGYNNKGHYIPSAYSRLGTPMGGLVITLARGEGPMGTRRRHRSHATGGGSGSNSDDGLFGLRRRTKVAIGNSEKAAAAT